MLKMFLFLIATLFIGSLSAKKFPTARFVCLETNNLLNEGSDQAADFVDDDDSSLELFFVVGIVLVATVVIALVIYYSNKSEEERAEKERSKRKNRLALRREKFRMEVEMDERGRALKNSCKDRVERIEKRAIDALSKKDRECATVVSVMRKSCSVKIESSRQSFKEDRKYYKKKAKRLKKQQSDENFWFGMAGIGAKVLGAGLGCVAAGV